MQFTGLVTSVNYVVVPPATPNDLVNIIVTTEFGDSLTFVRPASQAPAVGTAITITVALA